MFKADTLGDGRGLQIVKTAEISISEVNVPLSLYFNKLTQKHTFQSSALKQIGFTNSNCLNNIYSEEM